MKALTPYLTFAGNCNEAMNFYKDCFGGKLEIMTFADAPKEVFPGGQVLHPTQVMHACLTSGEMVLMASDNPKSTPVKGDTVSININCATPAEADQLFKALSAGGSVTMPLANTFWGAYFGMLQDRYGFHWMLNCQVNG